jgi:hypothetical protein
LDGKMEVQTDGQVDSCSRWMSQLMHGFWERLNWHLSSCYNQRSATFFCYRPNDKYFRLYGPKVSVTTPQAGTCVTEESRDRPYMGS